MARSASIVIPTRRRARYLEVALASIAPQAAALDVEIVVVDDGGPSVEVQALAERAGARYEAHPRPLGLNVARNTGVERSDGELVIFVDDDVEVGEGWLQALLDAVHAHRGFEVFTGPIHARLEGPAPHSCGRESAPITSLELGAHDVQTRYAWGANMAVRREALERVGPFDISLAGAGDEQEWQDRLHGAVLYVAGAELDHLRLGEDARLRALARGGRFRGQASRRFDAWRGEAPQLVREMGTLAGCVGHVIRRRCPAGLVMVAHSWGRLEQGLRERASRGGPPGGHEPIDGQEPLGAVHGRLGTDDFLSGESGTVGGLDGLRRVAGDELTDCLALIGGTRLRLARAARRSPPRRRILALGIERPERAQLAGAMRTELEDSRHEVELHLAAPGTLGKFQNLNLLLDKFPPEEHDWLLLVDDDVELPKGFLDRFLFLIERFSLDLAQPAHRASSHAAWRVTRRRAWSVLRETCFVEIGPVTAFAKRTFPALLPFPELRMGWGLDLHWAAIAREHGWRCGVSDAVAIGHRVAPAAHAYSREDALAEARLFLADRAYLSAQEAQRVLVTHRRW